MKKKLTVTVAVSAFNEEKNIAKFLKSVLAQQESNYILERIIVVSDGSTDKTVSKVKEFKKNKILLIENKKRIGKSAHLNTIYSMLTSDILVQSDADVIFSNPNIISTVVDVFVKNKDIAMCGGNPVPLSAKTFVEKAINITTDVYKDIRFGVNSGNNVFSADGRFLAYKKSFITEVTIPHDMIANDMFTYFCCVSKKLKYRFVPEAVVMYRSPQYISDHIRQDTRFRAAPLRMVKYFKEELVKKEFSVPQNLYYKSVIKQFFSYPIHTVFIFLLNNYIRLLARRKEAKMTAKWNMAFTTKKLT